MKGTIAWIAVVLALVSRGWAWTEIQGDLRGMTLGPGTYHLVADGDVRATEDNRESLTLLPGAVIKAAPGVCIQVGPGSPVDVWYPRIVGLGSPQQPVVLTSQSDDSVGEILPASDHQPEPGDWVGLVGFGSCFWCPPSFLDLVHTHITYAGAPWTGGGPAAAIMLQCTETYQDHGPGARLQDCIVSHSGGSGIELYRNRIEMERCLITSNNGPGLRTRLANSGGVTLIESEFSNNNGIAVDADGCGSMMSNRGSGNWINAIKSGLCGEIKSTEGFPFVTERAEQAFPNGSLTVHAGTVLKFMEEGGLVWEWGGGLRVLGQAEEPVIFTSIRDDRYGGDTNGDGNASQPAPGDWEGMFFDCNGTLNLDHLKIFYAGDNGGIQFRGCRTTHFSHVEVSQTSGQGIHVMDSIYPDSMLFLNHCTLMDNGGPGLVAHGSVVLGDVNDPESGYNVLVDNAIQQGGWQVENRSPTALPAARCWWGVAPDSLEGWRLDGLIRDDDEIPGAGPVQFEPWLTGMDAPGPVTIAVRQGWVELNWPEAWGARTYQVESSPMDNEAWQVESGGLTPLPQWRAPMPALGRRYRVRVVR